MSKFLPEMTDKRQAPSAVARVSVIGSDKPVKFVDSVVVEEPLEIRLKRGDQEDQLGITMRTPGADIELATGFLWGEGFLDSPDQLLKVKVCGDRKLNPRQRANIVIAEVALDAPPNPRGRERAFTITSACGVCGSSNIADLHTRGTNSVLASSKSLEYLTSLTGLLAGRQSVFERTGGLHAALLVDAEGSVRWVREDVGRHNAVDKVIGAALISGQLPLSNWSLVVSGRVGYELVQKAVVAGVSALVAVSAPTSLAIDLANEFNLTLLAFAREGKANKYSPLLG